MANNTPLISIITICYNSEKEINKTLKSIQEQSFKDFEYIIIDGASTDRTVEVINKYNLHSILVSEKDKGIYDAMNKGVVLATGRYLLFLNSGDNLHSKDTLLNSFKCLQNSLATFVYGKTIVSFGSFKKLISPKNVNSIWKGMPFSHQSVFILSTYQKENPYSYNFKICSDFNFLYHSYLSGQKFQEMDIIISEISSNGLSDTKRIYSLKERWGIVSNGNFDLRINFYYSYLLSKELLTKVIKKIIPNHIISLIRKIL